MLADGDLVTAYAWLTFIAIITALALTPLTYIVGDLRARRAADKRRDECLAWHTGRWS